MLLRDLFPNREKAAFPKLEELHVLVDSNTMMHFNVEIRLSFPL